MPQAPTLVARAVLGIAVASTVALAAGAAAELRVGLGEIEITPPLGSPMAGYAARRGVAESVHDPLLAQAVVLEDDDSSLALITVDLRRLTSQRIVDGVRALGIDHVVVAASHTHSGPDADPDTPWKRETEERLIELVAQARRAGFPARLAVATGAVRIGHNRRWVEGGEVTMLWRNAEERPTHPLDPTLSVIRIDDAEGAPRAALVHHACHPVVLGPDNLALSADWPGAMRRDLAARVQRELGEAIAVVFLQGAAGDINPFRDKQPVAEGGFEEVERVGAQVAAAAFELFEGVAGDSTVRPLTVRHGELELGHRWQSDQSLAVRLHTATLGSDLGLVFLPGEPFVEHQLTLSARSPLAATLLVGYATSGEPWPGYLPTVRAAVEGGYGAGYNTTIEVGAGEILVDRALIELYRSIGRLESPESGPVRSYR